MSCYKKPLLIIFLAKVQSLEFSKLSWLEVKKEKKKKKKKKTQQTGL